MDRNVKLFLEYFFDAIILLESFALANYLLLGVMPVTPFQGMADLENRWYTAISPASPYVALILMYAWVKVLKPHWKLTNDDASPNSWNNEEGSDRYWKFICGVALVVALLGSVYIWLPAVNPEREPVGVDRKIYAESLNITTTSLSAAFSTKRWGRMTIKIIVLVFRKLTPLKVADIVNYSLVAINPLLVAATYFMVHHGSGDSELAAYSALAMAMGYNFTVGTFAFFLSNNLALVFMFLSVGYLLKDLRNDSTSLNLKSLLFGALVPFTHTYTFYQFYGVLLLLLAYKLFRRVDLSKLSPLILYLTVLGLVFFSQKVFLPEEREDDDSVVVSGYKFTPFRFLESNVFIFTKLYTGLMGNTVFLLMSVVGAFYLDKDERFDRFLLLFLFATSIIYSLSHMLTRTLSTTSYLPSRLLYNTLLPVFSGYAATHLKSDRNLPDDMGNRVVILFYLSMAVYLFRSLYEIIHGTLPIG